MHINALELLAVFLAIGTFSKGKDCHNILIQTDNMTAKAHINHWGHPLANIELHSNPAVEIVPGSPGSPDSRIPPRGGEQDCR